LDRKITNRRMDVLNTERMAAYWIGGEILWERKMAEFGISILDRRRNTGKGRWQNLEFAYWIEEILWERKMAEFGICILDRRNIVGKEDG
jgi:recombinational DNA repair ATPase RecF